jgi:hypothetical protein
VTTTTPVEVQDTNGAPILRFIRLDNPDYAARWYGGTVGDWALELMPFAYGPHVWHTLKSMLDLIAEIADMPTAPHCAYALQGSSGGACALAAIGRHMDAREIATALGCDETEVTAHFERVVKVGGRGEIP